MNPDPMFVAHNQVSAVYATWSCRTGHRYYGAGYLHFITTSCCQRPPLLGVIVTTPTENVGSCWSMSDARRK